ncbi:phosphatase PAP2 family protein [Vibrio tapetis subsp. quintayensis]|uniref:phosphatase PAP2 family protein n=1 Tax=Vibrio tapetis TaxID=52443 RepID=UPI0025B2D36D|nr:phosphatase PAP2 family protein [Vibrio tapetis]MDN3681985.1 phosphatase PAP2 family protein [Vibrio tapetis subsp. quintayensis]
MNWSFLPKRFEFIAIAILTALIGLMVLVVPTPDLTSVLSDSTGSMLDILTMSAGQEGFLYTTALLCLLPLLFRLPLPKLFEVYAKFGALLVLSFVLKTGMKHITEVPRPYTLQLSQSELVVSPEDFYAHNAAERESIIEEAKDTFSPWRLKHWEGETNYSMPSGHTIFVAICVMFWGGFLLAQRQKTLFTLLIVWGVGVGFSRLWLGMHWPLDVMVSLVCAASLNFLVPNITAPGWISQITFKKRKA